MRAQVKDIKTEEEQAQGLEIRLSQNLQLKIHKELAESQSNIR